MLAVGFSHLMAALLSWHRRPKTTYDNLFIRSNILDEKG
jgi:hypothetical protein